MDINTLFEHWELAESDDDKRQAFREWRGDHLKKQREFGRLTQRELGERLELSQAMYTRFEQATDWKSRGPQLADLLKVPVDMVQNHNKARAFFGRDGGLTYVKLLEQTIVRWTDEGEQALEKHCLPVDFIRQRLNAEASCYPHDPRPDSVLKFMANPVANDLDQPTKRWLENILNLMHGSLVDLEFYNEKLAARQYTRREARRHFLANVERLLDERRWSTADLATYSGLDPTEVADNGKLLFQPLTAKQIAGVAVAFNIDFSLLTMENGTDLQRESAGAFMELPGSVRAFIAWLHSTVTETRDGRPADGAIAVTAMLPQMRAQLKQVHEDATRNPKVAEAMKAMFEAYRNDEPGQAS